MTSPALGSNDLSLDQSGTSIQILLEPNAVTWYVFFFIKLRLYTYICTVEFHLMDVSMDQPQQHWLGEQEGQGFYVEFSHFLSIPQGNLLTGIDNKTIT